jgi:hypothetical protein
MAKPPTHRFNIWSLADGSPALQGEPNTGTRSVPDRSRPVHHSNPVYDEHGRPIVGELATSDLVMLESLYDYGPSITVELPAKCTAPNGRSIAAKTRRIGTNAVQFAYDGESIGNSAKRCDDLALTTPLQFDLDQFGGFDGALSAKSQDGFEIAVDDRCKYMLSPKIAAFARRHGINFDEIIGAAGKRITRIEPDNKKCSFTDDLGTVRRGRIINLSPVDALITAVMLPLVSSQIVFGGPNRYLAEVLRTFDIGFAAKFCPPIPSEEFSAAIRLFDE